MDIQAINTIMAKMKGELLPGQMSKLEETLLEVLSEPQSCGVPKKRKGKHC